MFKAAFLLTFMVYCAASERISNVESPSWNRRTTTEDYGYLSGRDRDSSRWGSSGSSYDRDNDRWGSATERPGSHRFTYSWERDSTRSSYLDRFTTQSPYDSDRYDRYDYSSRRPSYQTDRWGDAIGGTTRSPYVTWSSGRDATDRWGNRATTDRWGYRDTTDRWGSSGSGSGSYWDRTTSRWGSGHGSNNDRDRFDRNEAYVRIIAELKKLTNDKGLTIDGSKCDTFGQCDPVFKVYLDTERPNAEFPGARDSKYWPTVFHVDDSNSPDIRNGTVTRDVCGVPYRDATLRVLVEDKDGLSSNDIINNFDCSITREPDSSETFAMWHDGVCTAKKQGDKMKLTFRYKVFVIPRSRCDPNSGALGGTTTKRRH
ncbi:uncharacterized protein LOC129590352 [Paramacrobiotus metropolitanus]|uniref:uncharacterized protein LOC129590352 n=1 Tax=Paramacrobiotus metropolitanus TaxID=2943436 RepID=UPI002445D032|nr:uncharacterized protein LOC129590352 [Paramacrobiotus metropolitanus]